MVDPGVFEVPRRMDSTGRRNGTDPKSSTQNSHAEFPAVVAGGLRVEVDSTALTENLRQFRRSIPPATLLMAVVKADGYGHGLLNAATAFLAGGADLLGVHSLTEAQSLREAGISRRIVILGPLGREEMRMAAEIAAEFIVGSLPACRAVADVANGGATRPRVHLKVETGVNRQGLVEAEFDAALTLLDNESGVDLVGLSSHFADIEDTTDHGFARDQMSRFESYITAAAERGHRELNRHMSCSAAAILWRRSHRDIVRVGISGYGIWPSPETLVSARAADKDNFSLQPALRWVCPVAQVKQVAAGATVGYGRSWQALTDSTIAVLPVGYADGYPRGLSDRAYVLVRGCRAPLRGRICMNLCMVDVTHIPEVAVGDEAVLLGQQASERITAEQLAGYVGTIAYEVLTWPGATWQRVNVARQHRS